MKNVSMMGWENTKSLCVGCTITHIISYFKDFTISTALDNPQIFLTEQSMFRKAKISCKTSMFKPSSQALLTPFGTLQRYTTLFDSFTNFSFHFYATLNFFSIMVRLTDVQRGRAIALLMQGQRQQQVANHFGVNVSTIESLVRRLRETGHLADRPRSGRPRVTSRRQDRTIRLAHLRNRHLTATETALNTVGTHNRQISPKTVGSRLREIGLRARRPYVGLL